MGQHLTVDQQPMIELGLLTSASHLSLQAMSRMNGAFHHAIGWEVDDVGGQGRPGVQDHGEPVVPNPKPLKPADPLAVQAIPDAASSQACRRRQVRARQFRQDALPPGIGGEQNPDRSDDDSVPDLKPSALRPHRAAPGQVVSDGVEELIRNAGAGNGSSLYEGRRLPNHGGANSIP